MRTPESTSLSPGVLCCRLPQTRFPPGGERRGSVGAAPPGSPSYTFPAPWPTHGARKMRSGDWLGWSCLALSPWSPEVFNKGGWAADVTEQRQK